LYDKHDYCTAGIGIQHIAECEQALRALPRGPVLELGAGKGEVADWCQSNGFQPYLGVDWVESRHPRIIGGFDITKGLGEIASGTYDYVWSFDVLEHLKPDDIAPLFAHCCRIARRGQVHAVWTCSDVRLGVELHTCRNHQDWWKAQAMAAGILRVEVRPSGRKGKFWLFMETAHVC
jgi:hypothetical protein